MTRKRSARARKTREGDSVTKNANGGGTSEGGDLAPAPPNGGGSVLSRITGPGLGAVHEGIVRELVDSSDPDKGTIVLVVNSVHEEGSSSVSQQIAAALVEKTDDRVLLVDANLRSPSQHQSLGVELSPGLYEVALGTPPISSDLCSELGRRFALLPAGQVEQDPARLMSSDLIVDAFDQLRGWFDWIVLDGPPVTIYAEAVTLGRLADATILVVEAESTRREVVDHAKKILTRSGINLLGIILNRRRHHIPDYVYRHL